MDSHASAADHLGLDTVGRILPELYYVYAIREILARKIEKRVIPLVEECSREVPHQNADPEFSRLSAQQSDGSS